MQKPSSEMDCAAERLGKVSEEVIICVGSRRTRVPEWGGGWAGAFGQIACKALRAEGATKFWEPGARWAGERSARS